MPQLSVKDKKYIFTVLKKKYVIIAVAVLLFLFACIGGFYINRARVYSSIEKAVTVKWKITLPENRNIKFAESAVHMDGHDYFLAYKFKEEPSEFLRDFSQTKNISIQNSMNEIITAVKNGGWIAPKNKIPDKYMPDWETEYYWKFRKTEAYEEYYMAYFPEKSLLIICERFYH